jgi:hypothetical protein
MNAVCGGTILYVCLTEIVPESFGDKGNLVKSGIKITLFGACGAAIIVLIAKLHSH